MKRKQFFVIFKFKLFLLVIALSLISCEGDIDNSISLEDNFEQTPTVTTINYEDGSDLFKNLTRQLKVNYNFEFNDSENIKTKSIQDTLGIQVYTDNIKEVKLGEYTSYTMRIVSSNLSSNDFYNLTIESMNSEYNIFITKYTPSEYWLNNRSETYQGAITTMSLPVFTTTPPEDGGGGGIAETIDDNNGGSIYYPFDCEGVVVINTEQTPYPCGCGHWPWDNCSGCPSTPQFPGYTYSTTYFCEPHGFSTTNPNNPTDGQVYGSGGSSGSGAGGSSFNSITVLLGPEEECEEILEGDLNGDCRIDYYEACLLNGYTDEICDCVANKNSIIECLEDEKCRSLKKLTNTDELSANILPIVTELRTKTGLNKEYSVHFEKNINFGEEYEYVSDEGIKEGISQTKSYFYSGTRVFGQIHTHPIGTQPIFSWSDVARMKDLFTDLHSDFTKSDIFMMIVNHDGSVYALKIDNFNILSSAVQNDLDNSDGTDNKEKEKDLQKDITRLYGKNSDNLEATFLNRFKDFGVSLYKATDQNLSNWNKLELENPENINSNIKVKPCN